jgi:hypothetical protein
MSDSYPKIETLFDRDMKTFNVDENKLRLQEFNIPKFWYVTEKLHGTNTRIIFTKSLFQIDEDKLTFGGRAEQTQMPIFLLNFLQETFTKEKMYRTFPDIKEDGFFKVTLYGEGYGCNPNGSGAIQSGGNYRKGVNFRLFDIEIQCSDKEDKSVIKTWWLEPANIFEIASKLGIDRVPVISEDMTLEEAVELVKSEPKSIVANLEYGNPDYYMEGIVARTVPLLFTRKGERLMWKLKRSDYHRGKSK